MATKGHVSTVNETCDTLLPGLQVLDYLRPEIDNKFRFCDLAFDMEVRNIDPNVLCENWTPHSHIRVTSFDTTVQQYEQLEKRAYFPMYTSPSEVAYYGNQDKDIFTYATKAAKSTKQQFARKLGFITEDNPGRAFGKFEKGEVLIYKLTKDQSYPPLRTGRNSNGYSFHFVITPVENKPKPSLLMRDMVTEGYLARIPVPLPNGDPDDFEKQSFSYAFTEQNGNGITTLRTVITLKPIPTADLAYYEIPTANQRDYSRIEKVEFYFPKI